MKWLKQNLVNVADVTMGQSPPGDSYNEEGKGIPLFQGKAEFGIKFPTVRKWTTAPTRLSDQGDILLSVRAPVGPTNVAPFKCCIGRGLASIRAHSGILDQAYLLYFLKLTEPSFSKLGQGSTFTAVNRSDVEKMQVPVPTLSEQRRIVEILDQADELRKKRLEADKIAERILPALFYKMFGDPVRNKQGWETSTLDNVCDIVTGNTPSRELPDYFGEDILWARPADLDGQIPIRNTQQKLSRKGAKVGRIIPQNSVLVCCIGATLGKTNMAGVQMAINQQINALLPGKKATPEFLYVFCLLNKEVFRSAATQQTLPILNKSRFGQQIIFLPPIELQSFFSQSVKEFIIQYNERQQSKDILNKLFSVLLQQAFNGDLTAKWREAHMKELLQEMEEQSKYLQMKEIS